MVPDASYYWLSDSAHRPGDVLPPGRWGQTVLSTPGHRWLKMEIQFEEVRRVTNVELPSRLDSSFLFIDRPTADLLRSKRGDRYLYRVALVDPDRPMHIADMALVHPELEMYGAQWGNPRRYWEIRPIFELNWPELITMSPFAIVELLDPAGIE